MPAKTSDSDTIAAVATPPGTGGIGIVRVSGDDARRIAEDVLGSLPPPRIATLASFSGADGTIDRGIALFFPRPHSLTGEDVLELHGHGGPTVMAMLVDAVVACGARRAEPGEFSKRAFLNDKLDLVQAEAVADLIESGTAQAARAALRSLSGEFSARVQALSTELTALRVFVEAAIDFPEDEIDFLSDDALIARIDRVASAFAALDKSAKVGRVLRDGFRVVLVGRPNAGKSSLMNRLSGEETAIVTEIAGTTRDVLRETISIDGLSVELVDTAGLRENPDTVEREGIRRAREAMQSADAVLWIQDASDDVSQQPLDELPAGVPVIVVRNKIDLPHGLATAGGDTVFLSAKTGDGIDTLREKIRQLAGYANLGEGAFTARQRHVDALERAARHFADGRAALDGAGAGELFAEELRYAHDALGEITGTVCPDDLLGHIFATFCIGK